MNKPQWFELEDTFLSNQPMIYRGGKRTPDANVEPTEYYLFGYGCRRTKRGVQRRFVVQTLKAKDKAALDKKLERFVCRRDVVFVGDQKRPDYFRYHGEPVSASEHERGDLNMTGSGAGHSEGR
jgi:hypothetical protein